MAEEEEKDVLLLPAIAEEIKKECEHRCLSDPGRITSFSTFFCVRHAHPHSIPPQNTPKMCLCQ